MEDRRNFRNLIEPYADYTEINVTAPIDSLKERDTKGFYHKSDIGLMTNLTGVGDAYEVPMFADITIDTSLGDEKSSVKSILEGVSWLRTLNREIS